LVVLGGGEKENLGRLLPQLLRSLVSFSVR
jgi:hypothetical protein